MNVHLKSGSIDLDRAFRTAMGDLAGNISPWPSLLDGSEKPVILAGLLYDRPWTRDAAINTWNGCGLLSPEITRNTLEAVLIRDEHGLRIGGQYWDAIIWVTGCWQYYLQSGDRDFLEKGLEASLNALAFFEKTEWDEESGLFRGAPCYADGISAYPLRYSNTKPWHDIHFWPRCNPDQAHPVGEGVPIRSLSGNALYAHAYSLLPEMAVALGREIDPQWQTKAEALKRNINSRLWQEDEGLYRYFEDHREGSDLREGMGHAFALLFDIADGPRGERILASMHTSPAGIPCLFPVMERYLRDGHVGRHNGTVWPPIQALWAEGALLRDRGDLFDAEFENLTKAILRDGQCAEVYHPVTGEEYGGLQEDPSGKIDEYYPCHRQTWSATAYIRMVLFGLAGLRLEPGRLSLPPRLPENCDDLELKGLSWQGGALDISISRGEKTQLLVNGRAEAPDTPIEAREGGLSLEMVIPR
jgi:glycogen debranching enzyme